MRHVTRAAVKRMLKRKCFYAPSCELFNYETYGRKRTNKHKFYINNLSILLTSPHCPAYGTVFAVGGTT